MSAWQIFVGGEEWQNQVPDKAASFAMLRAVYSVL